MAEKVTKKPSKDKAAKPKRATSVIHKPLAAGAEIPEAPATPPEPKPVMATVDLLEPQKKPRKPEGPRKVLIRPFLQPLGTPVLPPAPAPLTPSAAPEPDVAPSDSEADSAQETAGPGEPERKVIHIKPPIIVKDLAEQLGLRPFLIIKDLMSFQIFANINQTLEPDIVAKVCDLHGFFFEREKKDTSKGHHKVEVKVEAPKEPEKPKADELMTRAPIITFMGHVDHGKTSLLDAIRKARVAAGEAGGITQHIGAYSLERNGQKITFLDTPGHAAFTAMRARGAMVTDIVVLVVAADDGLMPQTLEAISHAKAAKVQIMVAINKIDLPSANIDRVKTQLQEQGLVPEDWGGEIICLPVSATKGTGISELLDMMTLQSEILELKSSSTVDARCTVIEAQVEQGRGPTATVIVRMGTLRVGDPFICGNYWGKVKQLINDLGKPVKEAGPATPVKVLGFSGLPNAGDELMVMDSEKSARLLGEERLVGIRTDKLAAPKRATLENLFADLAADQKPTLQIVIKCDVQGSLEAIVSSLQNIPQKKISLEIIHAGVGPITDSDVLLSSASNAIIIGFNTKTENSAALAAKREGIQLKLYSIIYELLDQVRDAMSGMLEPELRESVIGHAEVRQVFDLTKGKVAGCMVTDGRIARTARARLLRRRQPIYDGGLATLRRFTDDVKEVRAGLECGIKLGDYSEYMAEDVIECYTLEKIPQQL
ncbi:MAG: translation initiation factor IF-2 [Verrucomicrobiae bacterium]